MHHSYSVIHHHFPYKVAVFMRYVPIWFTYPYEMAINNHFQAQGDQIWRRHFSRWCFGRPPGTPLLAGPADASMAPAGCPGRRRPTRRAPRLPPPPVPPVQRSPVPMVLALQIWDVADVNATWWGGHEKWCFMKCVENKANAKDVDKSFKVHPWRLQDPSFHRHVWEFCQGPSEFCSLFKSVQLCYRGLASDRMLRRIPQVPQGSRYVEIRPASSESLIFEAEIYACVLFRHRITSQVVAKQELQKSDTRVLWTFCHFALFIFRASHIFSHLSKSSIHFDPFSVTITPNSVS